MHPFRFIPSVDKVLRTLGDLHLPRPVVLALVRRELDAIRAEANGRPASENELTSDVVLSRIRQAIATLRQARIQPVVNGTGIIVHTNFGRSPLGAEVVSSIAEIASNYNNLEYDLTRGERGGRAGYLEHNLAILCESEAATVVNNCAAALVLILRHFASTSPRTQVVISRGELVQIGGGFRVPDILEASGATLREIGTTNKTTLEDYHRAIGPQTALVLKVHRSNFFMGGFVESPTTDEIAEVARNAGVPLVEDLGSGAVSETETFGAAMTDEREPTPAEVLRSGADLVCFSGDKLLGGPQAGIIAGRANMVGALKREPFFRALRCDKLILIALQTTIDLHLRQHDAAATEASSIPIFQMMHASIETLRARATQIIADLLGLPLAVSIGEGEAQVGGGSLPRTIIPSITIDLAPAQMPLNALAERMRAASPPVVGYVSNDRYRLDLRTIFARQDHIVVRAVRAAFEPDAHDEG